MLFFIDLFISFLLSADVQRAVSFCTQKGFSAHWVPQKKNWHGGPSEPSAIVLSNLAPLPCLYFTWLQPSECNKEKHSVFKEKVDAKLNRICHHKMSDVSKAALLN